MEAILALVLIGAVIAGPLAWRARTDRGQARADAIRADILASINRHLRGESLLAVEVISDSLWRTGRVVLSAPGGYECLTQAVMPVVMKRMPAGYELVVHPGRPSVTSLCEEPELPRAA